MMTLITNKEMCEMLAHNALDLLTDDSWGKKRVEYYELVDGLVSAEKSRENIHIAT